ncbi:hypothetical protein [Rhizobium sp. BK376]|uniref:hypothetical protein n=1 Tax=Rhizobium sp. BK376 TaxID=2512149 RepID=UPI001FE19492|nr:hypothetical protein [Rhizobium sp. BK376]
MCFIASGVERAATGFEADGLQGLGSPAVVVEHNALRYVPEPGLIAGPDYDPAIAGIRLAMRPERCCERLVSAQALENILAQDRQPVDGFDRPAAALVGFH